MNIRELGEQYREKTDEELLRLAFDRDELTPEAGLTLTGELTRRGIASEARLDAARKDEQERKEPGCYNSELLLVDSTAATKSECIVKWAHKIQGLLGRAYGV